MSIASRCLAVAYSISCIAALSVAKPGHEKLILLPPRAVNRIARDIYLTLDRHRDESDPIAVSGITWIDLAQCGCTTASARLAYKISSLTPVGTRLARRRCRRGFRKPFSKRGWF
jgi:hypothetical protein